jgi:hypothetical protein
MMRTGGVVGFVRLRVIADQHVDQSVRAEQRDVRPVLAHLAGELDQQIGVAARRGLVVGFCVALWGIVRFVGAGVVGLVGRFVVVVGDAIEAGSIGAGANDEHLPIERENPLNILYLIAINSRLVGRPALLGAAQQQQRPGLTGGEDFAEFVEGHRQERAGFLRRRDRLDAEIFAGCEPARHIAAGEQHLIEPGLDDAELPDHSGR